jgi:hypothetical protein
VNVELPGPTEPVGTTDQVFLAYLDFFRATVAAKIDGLDEADLRRSVLPSGWTPLELVKHLVAMERRWLVWGFEGEVVEEPWFDERDDRWYTAPTDTVSDLLERLHAGGRRTRAVVERSRLDDVGRPGPRWSGDPPATLERVLFHVLQEYARHVGHLDVVRELLDGTVGE